MKARNDKLKLFDGETEALEQILGLIDEYEGKSQREHCKLFFYDLKCASLEAFAQEGSHYILLNRRQVFYSDMNQWQQISEQSLLGHCC